MAVGLPVIISNNVNIYKEVSEMGAGFVTDLNSKAIAAALEQLLGNENMRREMGDKGRLLVRERFTWKRAAMELLQVYERVIRGMPLGSANTPPLSGK
jgi:glycosyltransferase involved in cell wall biosynthesis